MSVYGTVVRKNGGNDMSRGIRIAFYGKGGIGKSTIAANVSACLAGQGMRVLQIGCDPKADSTRPLTEKRIPAVLEQMKKLGSDVTEEDILFAGKIPGVFCMEAGGPHAGTGCAGMGITAMESELERLGILEKDWDVILYDVLGDVVCGGFAVPMRSHFADRIYTVTSAEYMSLYAANNILSAIDYYSYDEPGLCGGLIWNHCRSDWDYSVAQAFSSRTGVPVIASVEESETIRICDFRKELLVCECPDSEAGLQIRLLADRIAGDKGAGSGKIHTFTQEAFEDWSRSLAEQYRLERKTG